MTTHYRIRDGGVVRHTTDATVAQLASDRGARVTATTNGGER